MLFFEQTLEDIKYLAYIRNNNSICCIYLTVLATPDFNVEIQQEQEKKTIYYVSWRPLRTTEFFT